MARLLAAVNWKSGLAALARSRKRATAVYEVVQEQQEALLLYRGFEQLQQRQSSAFFDPECLGDGGNDQVRVAHGDQRDEADAVAKVIEQGSRCL